MITRRLDSELSDVHRLSLSQFEVLHHLAKAPEGKIRMSEIAQKVLLTRSGVSRLVGGLEDDGLVERTSCAMDGRGAFARITAKGREKLEDASVTHVEGVRQLYIERFSKPELARFSALLASLPAEDA